MLTKDDRKFILKALNKRFEENNKVLDKKYGERNDNLVRDVIDLFTVTNERIDKFDEKLSDRIDVVNKNIGQKIDDINEKIDRVLDNLGSDFDSIENLEKRTGKLEEKVFPISA